MIRVVDLRFSYSFEDWGIEYESSHALWITVCKRACGYGSPTPSEQIDLVDALEFADRFNRGVNIFDRVFRIRQKSVVGSFRPSVAGDVESPYAVAEICQTSHKTVVFVVDVEDVRGIG